MINLMFKVDLLMFKVDSLMIRGRKDVIERNKSLKQLYGNIKLIEEMSFGEL